MGGWMPAVAGLIAPLYEAAKKVLFESKVIGTDDTGVKVLDPKLPFARTGRIWPYVGDAHHPVVVYDYTATRGRDGPAKFLEGYMGYLQADAYSVYDAFFKPARGLTEVGCMMHMRRYFFKALDSDQTHMAPALHLIARLYAVEDRARGLSGDERLPLRQRLSAPVMEKLHAYLLEIREQVLPKSPAARAVRYALNQWRALTRYLEDGDLEIDNGATERANRDIAIGRGNWTFFGSDQGGRTAAVLLSFIAMCKRNTGRALRLVPGRAHSHCHPPHPPDRGVVAAQLEDSRGGSPSLNRATRRPRGEPSMVVHETLTDDLILGFLDLHHFAELGGLARLAFTDNFGTRLEDADQFLDHVRVTPEDPRTGLLHHLLDPGHDRGPTLGADLRGRPVGRHRKMLSLPSQPRREKRFACPTTRATAASSFPYPCCNLSLPGHPCCVRPARSPKSGTSRSGSGRAVWRQRCPAISGIRFIARVSTRTPSPNRLLSVG